MLYITFISRIAHLNLVRISRRKFPTTVNWTDCWKWSTPQTLLRAFIKFRFLGSEFFSSRTFLTRALTVYPASISRDSPYEIIGKGQFIDQNNSPVPFVKKMTFLQYRYFFTYGKRFFLLFFGFLFLVCCHLFLFLFSVLLCIFFSWQCIHNEL